MNSWDKQRKETSLAYEWFCKYRNLSSSNRSQQAVIEKYSKKKSYTTQLARWSKRNEWVKRVEAYDAYLEDKIKLELEDERVTAARRHIDIAKKFFGIVEKKLAKIDKTDIKDMTATEMKALAEFAVKTERDALGITTELKVKSDVTVTDKMGDKVSKDFNGLIAKALAMRYIKEDPKEEEVVDER